jgi:predicted 2-oxoglutarate/Fe(II)-dependent dioxygenase YbiX
MVRVDGERTLLFDLDTAIQRQVTHHADLVTDDRRPRPVLQYAASGGS